MNTLLQTLRAAEWSDQNGASFIGKCPSCLNSAVLRKTGETVGHAPDCALAAAIEQAERLEALAERWERNAKHLRLHESGEPIAQQAERRAVELRAVIGVKA